ncbi:hypothetical protein AB990_19005 [Alkalihalobacillus pseudalcaliphilus]|nr:hypothetical protein AB990_19005 [Alkalihalobacillus pseudalcaliphilus]
MAVSIFKTSREREVAKRAWLTVQKHLDIRSYPDGLLLSLFCWLWLFVRCAESFWKALTSYLSKSGGATAERENPQNRLLTKSQQLKSKTPLSYLLVAK